MFLLCINKIFFFLEFNLYLSVAIWINVQIIFLVSAVCVSREEDKHFLCGATSFLHKFNIIVFELCDLYIFICVCLLNTFMNFS